MKKISMIVAVLMITTATLFAQTGASTKKSTSSNPPKKTEVKTVKKTSKTQKVAKDSTAVKHK